MQRHVRYWVNTGNAWPLLEMTRMTHHVDFLRDFGAVQHVSTKRKAPDDAGAPQRRASTGRRESD